MTTGERQDPLSPTSSLSRFQAPDQRICGRGPSSCGSTALHQGTDDQTATMLIAVASLPTPYTASLSGADRLRGLRVSTRGLVGFIVDSEEKLTEIWGDAYPSGGGIDVLRWLRVNHDRDLKVWARRLKVIDTEYELSDAEHAEAARRLAPLGVTFKARRFHWFDAAWTPTTPGARIPADWMTLGVMSGFIADDSSFARCSLYCEWGYVIDLDARALEVYRGSQRAPHSDGRFAHDEDEMADEGYHPIRRVTYWAFDALRDDEEFVAATGTKMFGMVSADMAGVIELPPPAPRTSSA